MKISYPLRQLLQPKFLTCFFILLPFISFAQITIKGRVINQADTKPVGNASIFLSNATVGDKTAIDGTFALKDVKPGKYELVVSIVGFDPYKQTITINSSITLPDITIVPKTIGLNEVKVTVTTDNDPFRDRNYTWFKDEFIGKGELAKECKIVNPQLLDLSYDNNTKKLTASSVDFLIVENRGLGYRLKYLISKFTRDHSDEDAIKVHYEGTVLFENLKGTPAQQAEWEKARLKVYEGSPIHFLRSVINNRVDEEGFRVLKYTAVKRDGKTISELAAASSPAKDLIDTTDQKGIYLLAINNPALHVTYKKDRRF